MIIREGYYFAGTFVLIAIIVNYFINQYAAILPAVLAIYCLYFFRNPKRNIPADENFAR